jgi:hemerythrin superfamily protein
MLAIGALGGAVLGRFLPVLVANASGALRGAAGRDPFAGLIREHRELLSFLTQMEQTSSNETLKRTALFFRFKRMLAKHALADEVIVYNILRNVFVRAKHALAEEDIVYPLLRNDAEREQATQKLYEEHANMKVLLFELERSVKDDERWVTCVRNLRAQIEPHARQEEEVEFPELRAQMDQQGNRELSRKIEQEESLIV